MRRSDQTGFRRYLPLLALFVILVLATVFVVLLPKIKDVFPAQKTTPQPYAPTYQTVAELDPETLLTVTVTHREQTPYTLINQDGILSLRTDDGGLESISASISAAMIKYATALYVEDTIASDAGDVIGELASMGLSPPQITVTAAYSDGSEITIQLGSAMLDTSYHYYMWSGDNSVYLCNPGVYETFEYTADMLRAVTQPPIIASLVERISIQKSGGKPITCTLETSETGAVRGTLFSPYAYPMKSESAQALLSAVANFRLGTRLEPLTDETIVQYGFNDPAAIVTIEQRGGQFSQVSDSGALQSYSLEPSTITFTLGSADGEYFRYCEYDGTCYRVSVFLIGAFLQADAASYAETHPADLSGDTLRSISLQADGGTLSVQASYLENVLPNNELETDEYGNIVYTTQATVNGDPLSADAFEALTARLAQMSVSGMLNTAAAPIGTPLWRMTLTTTQGRTRRLAAYPMDTFHDILAVDGVAVHYISKEALDIALGEFAALLHPVGEP